MNLFYIIFRKMKSIKIIISFAFSIISFSVFAQNLNIPLQANFNRTLESEINKSTYIFHTSFFPLNEQFISKIDTDSLLFGFQRDASFIANRKWKWFWRKLRTENLAQVKAKDYQIIINPLYNFSLDKDLNSNAWLKDGLFSVNTRGVQILGNIGKNVSFYTDFYENQAYFIDYLDEFAHQYLVAPGQGARKNFGTGGHDYAIVSGYLSFSPAHFINIQLGHGKHFIGNGYRSLLLSDNATVYPYLKFNLEFGKFQYVSLFSQNQAHYTNFLDYRYRNGGSFNYLSFSPNHRVELSVFEGLISLISDSTSLTNYPLSYFNPLILTRTAQYGLSNENNIILGFNARIKISKKILVYGQFMLDDLKNSKHSTPKNARWGAQAGIKIFNALSEIKALEKHNLFLQTEYNSVKPFSYSSNNAWQNYSHINQALAHPLGANFSEFVGILEYRFKDISLEFNYIRAEKGLNTSDFNFGSDIFQLNDFEATQLNADFSGKIGEGLKTIIENKKVKLSFLLNPNVNMKIFMELNFRSTSNTEIKTNSSYISFGLKTDLRNFYYDF